jgi:molybdate transport system ATP-binding protein
MSLSVQLEKKFPGFHLKVAFEHTEGSLGILGGSGMGKSMTLKMIAGLVKPDAGRVVVNGRVVYDSAEGIDLPARERKIGYLFQQYALFPTMTVADNIRIGMKQKGEEKRQAVAALMKQFSIENLGSRRPSELSGGQQQRVALARILASQPELLLLDEPFSALDGYLKEQLMEDMVCQLGAYQGDIVMVSHSRDEIYQCCEQLVVIDQGEVKAFGGTKAIFRQPGCVEAARLTGCKNIVTADYRDAHTVYVPEWQKDIHVEETVPENLRAIGIRAHYIELSSEKPDDGTNTLCAVTERITELPFEWYCFFRAGEGNLIWWKVAKEGEHGWYANLALHVGDTVYLHLPTESIILLT